MSDPLFGMQESVEELRDWSEEAEDCAGDESGPFLAGGRAIWTDGTTVLWCEAGEVTDDPPVAGLALCVERAIAAPTVRELKRTTLVKALRRGWVIFNGHEYRSGRVLAAIASVQGTVVKIAALPEHGGTQALVVRAGKRGAVIMQLEDPVDLLALPEAK